MANKLSGAPGKGIAVIGDGAMSAGMAYEAMNKRDYPSFGWWIE